MTNREKAAIVQQLREIRDVSTMKSANFRLGDEPFPFGLDVTELVKIATRLWRSSWIIGPLNVLIAELEGKTEQEVEEGESDNA